MGSAGHQRDPTGTRYGFLRRDGVGGRESGADTGGDDPRLLGHLQGLYEISKRLTRFDSVGASLPPVIGVVTEALGLRTAIVLVEDDRGRHRYAWHADGVDAAALAYAEDRARGWLAFLATARPAGVEDSGSRVLPPADAAARAARTIALPLTVDSMPIFGVLQLEAEGSLDEVDLTFANAVANQLAIALDRLATTEARQASAEVGRQRAEHAARAERLLATVGAAVSASLDEHEVLAAVARTAVPAFADACFTDLVGDDGTAVRGEVVFAGPLATAEVSAALVRLAGDTARTSPQATVLATGTALRVSGHPGLLVAPMRVRGKVIGALSFATVADGRRYGARELAMAEEIAGRTAMAVDNARLFLAAQRATRAREDLLAVVSHDLRSPLTTIVMTVDMLRRNPTPEVIRKRADAIERAGKRMRGLIDDLLDTASIESGTLTVVAQPVALGPIVAEALEVLEPTAETRSLLLTSTLPADLPDICADARRIHQVITNLVGNAIKFTPPGGYVRVHARHDGDNVVVTVSDNGPGITEEQLPRLFDRFWKATGTARLGTGLGLFIVKGIVEGHRGRIRVHSRPGEGTTFELTLPIA